MMKQRRLHSCGKSARFIGIPAILALLGLAGSAGADMAFQVKIKPTAPNGFEIRVMNETREPISGITFAIGSSTSRYLKLEQVDPGARILEPAADPGDVGVVRDVWTGIGGESIANLSNATAGFTAAPNVRELMTGLFESPRNWSDSYGQRIQGYFRPSVSGNYTFWITSDDDSLLQVDGVLVAHVTSGWTGWDSWTQKPSQRSAPIDLPPLTESSRKV